MSGCKGSLGTKNKERRRNV